MVGAARIEHALDLGHAREELGITDGMMRLSVGLEDPGDLIEDLSQALKSL